MFGAESIFLVLDSIVVIATASLLALVRMSAMKDITNYSPITAMAYHGRAADENVFVATTETGTPSRHSLGRDSNKRIKTSSTSFSSEEETTSNETGKEYNMSSVFMTPTEDRQFFYTEGNHAQEGCPVRKRLRLSSDCNANERVPIPIALNGLTKAQLVNLVNSLVLERHPELEEELHELIPEPDLEELEGKLKDLQHNIYKSFPHTRLYGSSRDVTCYRHVASHLAAFKKLCIEQGENLLVCQLWQSVVDYVLMAWHYVFGLPTWDSPAHNKSKEQCFKVLSVQCNKALKKCELSPEQWSTFQTRLQFACQKNTELQPCLEQVEGIIKKCQHKMFLKNYLQSFETMTLVRD